VKVLHVDSARTWRGGQNQVLLTARGMAARGHDVVVACQAGGALAQRARAAGVAVREVAFSGDLSFAAVRALRALMRESRPDVVQLHDPHTVSAGVLAGRLAGRPTLVATRRVDFPLRGPLSRRKYAACRRVIAVSEAIAAVLRQDGLAPEYVRVVHEGVPDRAPQPGGREVLRELGIPDGASVVGNVAALTGHKDQATLLAAAARVAARMPDTRFVFVGEGELRGRLVALARDLGLQGRCVFTGFRADLDRLIPAFTVFCLSSHMEGLGTSLLDAMAFGVPVVATAAGGIPEAVTDRTTGRLVPPRNPEALADALLEALQDPARRAAWGRAGRRRFEERFTADRMVEATLAVYAELS
jgi:glycosyltransferase involved in cell wall biosynthesis